MYSRYSANSMLKPWNGLRCWPLMAPSTSRLDRNEPALNTSLVGDPRDTTTPAAMLNDLRLAVLGKVLSAASRDRLAGWLAASQTGKARLRAGLPGGWRVGDKTGTGAHGTANDIAVVWTETQPILITSYLTGAERASDAARDAAHAEVGRIIVEAFRPATAKAAHG